jgi:hypothetical protein
MSSAALANLDATVFGSIVVVERLLVCATGAIHIETTASLYIFLKTAYALLKQCSVSSIYRLAKARLMTRGIRQSFRELFTMDVIRRMDVSFLSHIAAFSLIIEPLFDESRMQETMRAIELMVINLMLTVKYIEYCLPVYIIHDDTILGIEDLSEHGLSRYYKYRYMHGMLQIV